MHRIGYCILLGCLPWMVGCDYAHASDRTRSSTGTSAAPERAKDDRKPLSFSEFPSTDPLIQQAIEAKKLLIQQEEELLESLENIRKLLETAKVDGAKLRRSVEEFLQTAKDMRAITTRAVESMQLMIDQTSHLQRTTRHLGSSYRAVGELFRKKANDYSEKRFREQLEGFAHDYEEIARSIPERQQTLLQFQKQLPGLRRKASESLAFLDDVILYLSSHPGIGSNPSDEYSARFESFAVTFSDWLRTLEELRNTLRGQAVSKVIQASYQQELRANAAEKAKQLEQARLEEEKRLRHEREKQAQAAELARQEAEKRLQLEREQQAKAAEVARQQERSRLEDVARRDWLRREEERLAREREKLARERQTWVEEKARSQRALNAVPPAHQYGTVQPTYYYVSTPQPVVTYYVPACQPQWHPVR